MSTCYIANMLSKRALSLIPTCQIMELQFFFPPILEIVSKTYFEGEGTNFY